MLQVTLPEFLCIFLCTPRSSKNDLIPAISVGSRSGLLFDDVQGKTLMELCSHRTQKSANGFCRAPFPANDFPGISGISPQLQHGYARTLHDIYPHALRGVH
jgi:hypothetical protein